MSQIPANIILEQRRIEAERDESIRAEKYRELFNTPLGKWVLADMDRAHGYHERVFTLSDKGDHLAYDPLRAALKDGGRDVVIRIHNLIETPLAKQEKKKPKIKKL